VNTNSLIVQGFIASLAVLLPYALFYLAYLATRKPKPKKKKHWLS